MTYFLPKNFKNCLTCAFWCGNRWTEHIERYAVTESTGTKGQCVSQKGFYHLDMNAQASCSGYQPWPALKD